MVKSEMSLTRSGLNDWLIQRISAVIIGIYTLFLLIYCIEHRHLNYFAWQHLFTYASMRFFSLLTLLSLVLHAWVGVWTIITDYIKSVKLKYIAHCLVALLLVIEFIWGMLILWKF